MMTEQLPGDPGSAGPTESERNWAMAMHLVTLGVMFLGGWQVVVPLVGLLWKGGESGFVADHSREQLNFQISLIIYTVVAFVLAVLTLGIGLLVIVPIALLVGLVVIIVTILAAVAANRGDAYRFPLTIRMVR